MVELWFFFSQSKKNMAQIVGMFAMFILSASSFTPSRLSVAFGKTSHLEPSVLPEPVQRVQRLHFLFNQPPRFSASVLSEPVKQLQVLKSDEVSDWIISSIGDVESAVILQANNVSGITLMALTFDDLTDVLKLNKIAARTILKIVSMRLEGENADAEAERLEAARVKEKAGKQMFIAQKAAEKASRAKNITVVAGPTPNLTPSFIVYDDASLSDCLKSLGVVSLVSVNDPNLSVTTYSVLKNGEAYTLGFKPGGPIDDLNNAIRSRCDYQISRALMRLYGVDITFVANDFKLKKANGDPAGDVDTFLEAKEKEMVILVERKRTVGSFDEIFLQVAKTKAAFEEMVKRGALPEYKNRTIITAVFAEAMPASTIQSLREVGVHVMLEGNEFFDALPTLIGNGEL